MSERYTKLFSLPEKLYSSGSPVVIAAGALLKDNESGKVLAQLKLQSLSDKIIKAATVTITPYDTVGTPLGNVCSHQYLDLKAERDSSFGSKVPIVLPNASTRSFTVAVNEVIFNDNTIWTYSGEPWDSLSDPEPLSKLQDRELIKQFRLTYGQSCKNLLLEEKDLWHCTCSSLNRASEPNCHLCRTSLESLRAFDLDELTKARDSRLQEEKENKERAAQEAEEYRRRAAQKTKKIAKIAVPAVIACILIFFIATNVIMPSVQYKKAEALLVAGEYDRAAIAFRNLGDYRDSAQKAKDVQKEQTYQKAVQAFEDKDYWTAYEQFAKVYSYKDAKEYMAQYMRISIEEIFRDGNTDRATEYIVQHMYDYDVLGNEELISLMNGEFVTTIGINNLIDSSGEEIWWVIDKFTPTETFSHGSFAFSHSVSNQQREYKVYPSPNTYAVIIQRNMIQQQLENNSQLYYHLYKVTDDIYIATCAERTSYGHNTQAAYSGLWLRCPENFSETLTNGCSPNLLVDYICSELLPEIK